MSHECAFLGLNVRTGVRSFQMKIVQIYGGPIGTRAAAAEYNCDDIPS